MSKEQWKGAPLLAPVPAVLIGSGDGEKVNLFTVAWTGIINSNPPKTYISVRPERYSYEIIEKSRQFTINLPASYFARKVDLCGVKSGRDCDKFSECGFTPAYKDGFTAPMIEECPLSMNCTVTDIIKMGSHDMFIADINDVFVSGKLLDEKGKLHLEKASLLAYCHGDYFALGKKVGDFGFSVRRRREMKTKKSLDKKKKK